jgi:hypothetical protein
MAKIGMAKTANSEATSRKLAAVERPSASVVNAYSSPETMVPRYPRPTPIPERRPRVSGRATSGRSEAY